MDSESSRRHNQESILHDQSSEPRKLTFQYLKEITNNFSNERELGKGGFSVVYKGVGENGEMVAVKMFRALMPRFQRLFDNEVYHLMRLKHPNIVRCVGYCYETQNECLKNDEKYIFVEVPERLLCLEYLPNGSLDKHLADESCGLDWHKRYNIIKGICCGLHYLHEEWQINTPIIHLDLKPANILLDYNMVPKIADFGLSRLFTEEQTRILTAARDGTLGYMAPEYLLRGIITIKSDIFSLGVIIIEIITGHRNYPYDTETSCQDFVERVLISWRSRLEEASSYTSLDTYCQQIGNCLEMGLSCMEPDPTKRPATREIIERLKRLESTTCHVSSVERSPTVRIRSSAFDWSSYPRELLVINPRELRFCLELTNKRICCLVQLTNKTEDHVAFYFGVTRATNGYYIEPTSGFLLPRSTFNAVVTMEKRRELPLKLQCNDEILVKSIVVSEDRLASLSSWYIREAIFNMSSNVVHKVKLTVVYVPPAQPPSLLHVGSEETENSDPQRLQQGFTDQEKMDILIRCICQDLGFSNGRPISACIIYWCLLHWKSFEAGRTNVFSHIIASMFSTIKAQGNDKLAYWLSNSSTLLLLMQRTLKTAEADIITPSRRRKSSTSIFRTIFTGNRAFLGSHLIGGKGNLQQVEAKRPALLFMGHLTGFLKKVYGMIRDNLMKEISPLVGCCIQAPIISEALFGHWQIIVEILTDYLSVLKSNYVPSFLISKVFTQVFSFINAELFNSLLLSECCSFSNGEYVKAGLAKLEQWCIYENKKYAGSSWEELKHVRQAAVFLTIHEKQKKTLKEITNDLCPVLSIQQLYRISTVYRDDKYDTRTVSPEVLSNMESIMMEDWNIAENYYLLLVVDSTSIPFSVDDIQKSVSEFELTDVEMPPLIREDPCFNFLHQINN